MQVDTMKRRWVWMGIAVAVLLGVQGAYAQALRSPELNVQYHRAETAWRSGTSMLEAKARVDRVLKALPDDREARKLRAQVLMALGRHEEALDDAIRAVELDPKDGEAHVILCEAARLTGNLPQAEKALDDASHHLRDQVDLHIRLSWNAVELEQLDKAEAFARIALNLDSLDAGAYYQLARVFMLQGVPDNAATILARGFRASLLDAAIIRQDPPLQPLLEHPDLQAWLAK